MEPWPGFGNAGRRSESRHGRGKCATWTAPHHPWPPPAMLHLENRKQTRITLDRNPSCSSDRSKSNLTAYDVGNMYREFLGISADLEGRGRWCTHECTLLMPTIQNADGVEGHRQEFMCAKASFRFCIRRGLSVRMTFHEFHGRQQVGLSGTTHVACVIKLSLMVHPI